MKRILSWICYYLGDWSCSILSLADNSELWVTIWFRPYQTFMAWSSELQDSAGFDPQTGVDTSKWPWQKAEPQGEGEE